MTYSTLGLRPFLLFTGAPGVFPLLLPFLPQPLLFCQFLRRRLRERYIKLTDELQVNVNLLHPLTAGPVRRMDNNLIHELQNHRRGQHREIGVPSDQFQELIGPVRVGIERIQLRLFPHDCRVQFLLLPLIPVRQQLESLLRQTARGKGFIGVGGVFFLLLLGLLYYFEHTDITCLTEVGKAAMGANTGLSGYELSLFFTIFVFLQFWNMFNARAFETGRSAFHFKGCGGFGLIALVILLGQVLIVSVGGDFFNVEPLKFIDWVIIIAGTSLVLWIGELIRLFKK